MKHRYSTYKSSGVEWIGEIPSHWSFVKLKYEYNIQKGKLPNEVFEEPREDLIPYLSMEYLRDKGEPKYVKQTGGVFINEGDLLILWDGSNSGEILKGRKGILSSTTGVLKKIGIQINEDYSYYILKCIEPEIRNNTVGMGIPHVDGDFIRSLSLLTPPLTEQEQIVKFLDEKTTQIDSLISITEKKIELLKQKRTSLINEVVTKGLNPDVELKDSGVEWIGEIPLHWKGITLRYLYSKIGSGVTPRGGSEVYVDEGVVFIRSQNVHFDGLRLDDVVKVTKETHQSMSGTKVRKNDVLLNITGGSIGRCCLVDVDFEMNVNQHVCIIRCKENLRPNYLNLILQSMIGQTQVDLYITGGNREGLNIDNIKNFLIPLPPLSEQEQIVEYIDSHTTEIDQLVSIEQRRIETLKEYRQSLISEVVTGKVRVCEEELEYQVN